LVFLEGSGVTGLWYELEYRLYIYCGRVELQHYCNLIATPSIETQNFGVEGIDYRWPESVESFVVSQQRFVELHFVEGNIFSISIGTFFWGGGEAHSKVEQQKLDQKR
jgi:hypothetical protein